ncbi:HAMP domain-containing protein, partial [Oharaeibacter diazotrophicus]
LAAALDTYAAAPPAGAAATRADLDRAVGAVWEVATAELSRLLGVRTEGFQARLWRNLSVAGAVTLVIFLLVGLVSHDITRSIDRVVDRMTRLAEGDLSAEVPFADRRNELGRIARSVIVFRDALERVARLRDEREADERRAAEIRRSDVRRLAAAFEESVGGIARTVGSAALRLEASAGALTEASASAASRSADTAGA